MLRLLFAAFSLHAAFALLGGGSQPGGWSDVTNTQSPQFKQAILTASDHVVANDANYALQYTSMISAKQQIVNGIKYKFVLEFSVLASKKGLLGYPKSIQYDVTVYQPPSQNPTVLSATLLSTESRDNPPSPCIPGGPCKSGITPEAQQAATAVSEHMTTNYGYTVSKVEILSVKTQVVAGVNYFLRLRMTMDDQTADFDATVYRSLGNVYTVKKVSQLPLSESQINLPLGPGPVIGGSGGKQPLFGGYRSVNIQTDLQARSLFGAAAEFAIREISKKGTQLFKVLDISNTMKQVVAGMNLKFDVEATARQGSEVYDTVVYVPLGSDLGAPKNISFQLTSATQIAKSLPR